MLKVDEMNDRSSCFNRAGKYERIFVLLARDNAAAETIRFWAKERVRIGKNKPDDKQILDALEQARLMDQGR